MQLRRLTAAGQERFRRFLAAIDEGLPEASPEEFLEDDLLTEIVLPSTEVDPPKFERRLDAAKYFEARLKHLPGIDRDGGVWSWLAWLMVGQLVSKDSRGAIAIHAESRWIADVDNFQRYYRHLLAGPFLIYRAHLDNPARAMAVLSQPLNRPGDVVEQVASRQELITNRAFVAAATALYFDRDRNATKPGAGGKGPGSARRLVDVTSQLDVNWDLYGMSAADFIELLPAEFKRFRDGAREALVDLA